MGEAFDGKERGQHQNLEHLKVDQPAVGTFHAAKAATIQINAFKQACKCIITALRRFSLKKLRISDGIFVILSMALSFEYCFFATSNLLIFRDTRKYSKPFLCNYFTLIPKSETWVFHNIASSFHSIIVKKKWFANYTNGT